MYGQSWPDFEKLYLTNSTVVLHEFTLTVSSSLLHRVSVIKSRRYRAGLSQTSLLLLPDVAPIHFVALLLRAMTRYKNFFKSKICMKDTFCELSTDYVDY